MKNLQQVYAYVVCLLTLMCGIVAGGFFVYSVIRVSVPTFTLSGDAKAAVATNFQFRREFGDKDHPLPSDDSAVTKLREQRYHVLLDTERTDGSQGIAFEGIILIIDGVVFLLHWWLRGAAPEPVVA